MRRTRSGQMPSTSKDDEDDELNSSIEDITPQRQSQNQLKFEFIKDHVVYKTGSQLIKISKDDIESLSGKNYLNDKIIEFYLEYIKDNLPETKSNKVHIFSSFFFSKMLETKRDYKNDNNFYANLYQQVYRWTKNIDIFEYDFLVVPIFKNKHWSVAILCYLNKLLTNEIELDVEERPCLIYFDSIEKSKTDKEYLAQLKQYGQFLKKFVEHELINKKEITRYLNTNDIPTINPRTPYQKDDYNCGIFLLHYVELFLKDPGIIFKNKRLAKVNLKEWFKLESLAYKRGEIGQCLLEIHKKNLKEIDDQKSLRIDSENDEEDDISVIKNDFQADVNEEVNSIDVAGRIDAIENKVVNEKVLKDKFDRVFAKNSELNDLKFVSQNNQITSPIKSPNYQFQIEDSILSNSFSDFLIEPDVQIEEINIEPIDLSPPSSFNIPSNQHEQLLPIPTDLTGNLNTDLAGNLNTDSTDLYIIPQNEIKQTNKSDSSNVINRTKDLSIQTVNKSSNLIRSLESPKLSPNKKMKLSPKFNVSKFSEYDFERLVDLSQDGEDE